VSGDLGAVEEDVPFDWDGADTLAWSFDDLADRVESQMPTRDGHLGHAMRDATGRWAQLFGERAGVGMGDASELVAALRDAAEDVRAMRRTAEEEQARREAARAWQRAYDENEATESVWNKFTDWIGGEDFAPPPMPDPPKPEPHVVPRSPAVDGRA
jgi:sRNA-binding protein